jgi:hypothetical protein
LDSIANTKDSTTAKRQLGSFNKSEKKRFEIRGRRRAVNLKSQISFLKSQVEYFSSKRLNSGFEGDRIP